jgi:hypothetical protein
LDRDSFCEKLKDPEWTLKNKAILEKHKDLVDLYCNSSP